MSFKDYFKNNHESLKIKQTFLIPYQIVFSLTGLPYSVIYYHYNFPLSALSAGLAVLLNLLFAFLTIFRPNIISYRIIANASIGIYLSCILTTAYLTGGLVSPAGFWLPSVILLAMSLVGFMEIIIWSTFSLAGAILLIILEYMNPVFFTLSYQKLPQSFIVISTFNLIIVTIALIVITEILRIKSRQELELTQHELERSAILAELSQVSAGIAHEINNPLQIISGQLSLLERKVSEDISSDLLPIKKQITRVSKIINGLKNLSRDGAHDELCQVLPSTHIKELIELKKANLNTNKINIEYIPEPHDSIILFREVQFIQVVHNILNNAIDFLVELEDSSQRWITISELVSANFLLISISNGGNKIDPDVIDKIFNPFFTTKKVGKGTGLGLSISKSIMEKNNGKLYVDVKKEHTTFVLEIPLYQKVAND